MKTRLINSDQLSYNGYPGIQQRRWRNKNYREQVVTITDIYKKLQIEIPPEIKDLPNNYPDTPAAQCSWNCDTPWSDRRINDAEACHQETLAAIRNGENSYNNDQTRLEEARLVQEVLRFAESAKDAANNAKVQASATSEAVEETNNAVKRAKEVRYQHSWAGKFSVFKQKAKENIGKVDVIKGINKLLCSF